MTQTDPIQTTDKQIMENTFPSERKLHNLRMLDGTLDGHHWNNNEMKAHKNSKKNTLLFGQKRTIGIQEK